MKDGTESTKVLSEFQKLKPVGWMATTPEGEKVFFEVVPESYINITFRPLVYGDTIPDRNVDLVDSRVNKVYLAGPMTGYENYNFDTFNKNAEELRSRGYLVVNPADHGVVDGAQWEDYLRYDISNLMACEAIFFLPGWENSKGACLEKHIAESIGLRIEYL